MDLQSQRQYWDSAAGLKKFQHSLRHDWLESHLAGRDILDCGCGYGRLLADLAPQGYRNVVGTDFSGGMLRQGKLLYRELQPALVQTDGVTLPFRNHSFDAVLLFTLLTCMPLDKDQRGLFSEVRRVLRPGGLIYISDLLLNTDARNVDRYRRFVAKTGTYGVFELPEGVVVRHHGEDWIWSLTNRFERLEYETFSVITMNGNRSAAFRYLGRLHRHT